MRHAIKLTVFCLILSSLLFATDYRFVKIDFPDAASTIASGINARGDIVGRYEDFNGVFHGFLLRKGIFSSIDFPGASFTSARAINARGDIAGRIHDANGNDHAFLLRDGQFTQIDYPGADRTVGRGINNVGDITGNYATCSDCERGFILRDGVFQNISFGDANDVWMAQDNGQVMVGDADVGPGGALHGYIRDNPPLHGFLLRQGKYVAIDFPGSTSSNLLAINDDGVIVGHTRTNKASTTASRQCRRTKGEELWADVPTDQTNYLQNVTRFEQYGHGIGLKERKVLCCASQASHS